MGEIRGVNPFKPVKPEGIAKVPKKLGGKHDLNKHLIDVGDKVELKDLPVIGKEDVPQTPKEPDNLRKPEAQVKPDERTSVPKYLLMEDELPVLGGPRDLLKPLGDAVYGPSNIPTVKAELYLTPQRGNLNTFWANLKVG